ncbi:MAG: dihydrolipoamide acetyltransferase family protein [Planctomycetota bacterium]
MAPGKTSSDPNVFILPDLGEGVHEAELIAWRVSPGETVEEHQIVAEMETDKALVEVPSPRSGTIKELFGNVGDILKVGNPAWSYEGAGAVEAPPTPAPAPSSHAPENGQAEEREDAGTVVGTMDGQLRGVTASEGKALATPAVRRIARDLGVNIDAITGTGLAGRVTERDVRAAAQSGGTAAPAPTPTPAAPAPAPVPAEARRVETLATTVSQQQEIVRPQALVPAGDTSRIAFRGVRRTIANRLRQSVDTAVHFSVMDDADVSQLNDVRKRVGAASGEKISYLPFVASATMRALREFPALNSTVDDEREEIVRHGSVHLGIAADTAQGLSVPVIANADMLGVLELSRHIGEIATAVRDRSIPAERLRGSTFTISNVGSYAGKYATPIINYPEVGILAAGRVFEGVIADRGAIRVAKLLPLSLTCDHRSVDGAEAARCLARIIDLLQRPEELLTPARLA